MSLKHADIWRAIDRLAERNGLSASGLAKKAGLSPTVFNTSKRASATRKRWPSTESIACILRATNTTLDDFVALAAPNEATPRATLPMIGFEMAQQSGAFDADGNPSGRAWEEIGFPAIADARAFAVEVTGHSGMPVYREGDRLILSPAEKPRRGDRIVVRKTDDSITIGAMGRQTAQTTEIAALAPDAPPIVVPSHEIEWIGRIVWASQ